MVVKIKDNGFNKYKNAFEELNSNKVAVGLFAREGDDVLIKGIANEFGARTKKNVVIPERSFVRSTYNKNIKKVSKRFNQIARSISKGDYNVVRKLKLIGIEQESAIKQTIVDLKYPANAPSTIAKKGSSNPLIDTGEMRNKISSELRKK